MRRSKATSKARKRRVGQQQERRHQRPTREEVKARRKNFRAAQKALRRQQLIDGLCPPNRPAASNTVSPHESKEEEIAERKRIAANFIATMRPQLPGLLEDLKKIKDPRNPKKIEHQLTMVLLYTTLCFVLQMESRREGNRELTGPVLLDHLRKYFPELDGLPHQDTVKRILAMIDVEKIQDAHLGMVRRLIRNKKFNRFLINGKYPIAIDGTQKLLSGTLISPEWQERTHHKGTAAEKTQYNVYVLEACLSFSNGMTLPLLSEFLNYEHGDTEAKKQDCETKAFHRLTARLKEQFPRLQIVLLLDGLYPSGPIIETCRKHKWGFMIVLKDGSLPSVWAEFNALIALAPKNRATRTCGVRRQNFQWANEIDYAYGNNDKKHLNLHVIECRESWEEIDPETAKPRTRTSRHVWISSDPLTKQNLHERCNLAARHRWNIEEALLAEKRHGYKYEHCFSTNWAAMKGYHYLMHLGHALNVLAQYSEVLIEVVQSKGVRAFIKFIRDCFVHPWIIPEKLIGSLSNTPQLRLA